MNPPKIEPIHSNFSPISSNHPNDMPDLHNDTESLLSRMNDQRNSLLGDQRNSLLGDPLGISHTYGDPRGGLPHVNTHSPSLYGRDPHSHSHNHMPPLGQYGVAPPMQQHHMHTHMMMGGKAPGGYNQFTAPGGMYGGMMHLKPCYLIVDIFHKQRGGKGVWMVIEHGGLIRVTKNVGKRIKLVIKSSIKFERNEMKLILFDLINPQLSENDSRFSIENVLYKDNDLGGVNAEYELKIFILAKKLEFQVTINSPLGRFKAESNTFGTHNSGKQRKKRESVEPRPKFVLVPFSVDNQHQISPPQLSHNSHMMHQQQSPHMIPSMPIKRPRNGYEEPASVKKKFHTESSYSDMRLNLSHLDFSSALKMILERPDDVFEWNVLMMNVGMETDIFPMLANEIYRKYPDAVSRSSNDKLSVRYADMIPVILFNFTLYLDLQEDFDIDLDQITFSDAKIRMDAFRFYERLKNIDDNPMKMYRNIPETRNEMNTEEYLQKMQQYKDLLLSTESTTGIAVSVYLHTMSPPITDFFLVIYKSESLYQQKALSYGNEYKYVFIEPGDDNTYDGEYSVVLYIEAEFHRLQGFVGLYDIRGGSDDVKENIILCNPIPITNSTNLFIVGKFFINENESSWITSKV